MIGNRRKQINKYRLELFKRKRRSRTLRMTAMIDIIFLLLIFFLLTAKFRPIEDYLPMNMAGQAGIELGRVEPLVISVVQFGDGCMVEFSGRVVEISDDASLQSLIVELKNVLESQGRTAADPVELVCDDKLSWQRLVDVYNLLFGMGINDISFRMTDE